jgi:hypothetical protein
MNLLARALGFSSSKLIMRVQLFVVALDRPPPFRNLGFLTVTSPRPVERSGQAACADAPALYV